MKNRAWFAFFEESFLEILIEKLFLAIFGDDPSVISRERRIYDDSLIRFPFGVGVANDYY